MSIGDYLYRLTARDEQVTQLDLVYAERSFAGATISFSVSIPVPASKVLALKHFNVTVEPGGGQSTTRIQASIQNEAGTLISELMQVSDPAGLQRSVSWSKQFDDLIVAPSHRLFFLVEFSAAAAVNNANFGVVGTLLPRGSFSLGQL